MKKIEFEAVFGNERKKVEIIQGHGAGLKNLQLMVDKYYCGTISKRNDEWIADLNERSWPNFTGADIEIIGQIIEKANVFDV